MLIDFIKRIKDIVVEKALFVLVSLMLMFVLICIVVGIFDFTKQLKKASDDTVCDSTKYKILSVVLGIILLIYAIVLLPSRLLTLWHLFKKYVEKYNSNRMKYD